ncbi:hypothetical protein CYLTODRAFT_43862 [Cylindrobasidium torrendii FP15055 ss-10]|uniref:Uncharacterized protein n=1 Tax=Cylindrobasidium torrendii FP15055 ss-10 TaxID=1314674 RepID=A0A0D7B942_9AGAR|nr:hypothetical protein CYLTODRAFT_43862 [Cylindrobasidium torrendii FP15055 ss-10]
MAVVPDILKKFGVSEDSPSLTLYLTLAPYLFLESVISKWMGGDDEDSDDDSKKPVNKDKKKKPADDDDEEASDDKKTKTDDKAKDDKKDKKDEDKSKVLPDAVRRAGKSNVTIKKVIALQKKMDANKREVEEAKVALNRLKEDQSLDDQQARLQTVLIDIQNIQGDIADISPKIRMLGTVYDSVSPCFVRQDRR